LLAQPLPWDAVTVVARSIEARRIAKRIACFEKQKNIFKRRSRLVRRIRIVKVVARREMKNVTKIANDAVTAKRTIVRTIGGTVRVTNPIVVEMIIRTENESMKAKRNIRSATRKSRRTSVRKIASPARRILLLWESR
jgi:hypothetical protein